MTTQPMDGSHSYTGPESFMRGVGTAARYAGEAAAMATRYAIAGDAQRVAVWSEEHDAWRARMDEQIGVAPVQRGSLAEFGEAALNGARAQVQVYCDPFARGPR